MNIHNNLELEVAFQTQIYLKFQKNNEFESDSIPLDQFEGKSNSF